MENGKGEEQANSNSPKFPFTIYHLPFTAQTSETRC